MTSELLYDRFGPINIVILHNSSSKSLFLRNMQNSKIDDYDH